MNGRPGSLPHVKTYWMAYVVLSICLLASIASYFSHRRHLELGDQARLDHSAQTLLSEIEAQLQVYITMMKGVRALFSASTEITHEELTKYFNVLRIEDLQEEKGLSGVGVVLAVKPEEIADHVASIKKYRPSYRINTKRTNQTIYPITYLERFGHGPEESPLGWDVGQNPLRLAAIEQAKTSTTPILTARTEILYTYRDKTEIGFVVYLPFYRAAQTTNEPRPDLAGFIFSSFGASNLWSSRFARLTYPSRIEVFDGAQPSSEKLIYDKSAPGAPAVSTGHLLRSSVTEEIFGRTWTLRCSSVARENIFWERQVPAALLVVGIGASFVLFGFVFFQTSSRQQAERLTRSLTASEQSVRQINDELARKVTETERASRLLRESESLYQSLVETMPQGVFRKDLEGRFTFGNAAFCAMYKISPADLPNKSDADFFPPPLVEAHARIEREVVAERSDARTVSVCQAGSETRYLEFIRTPLFNAQGIVIGVQGVVWDVTEAKASESRLASEKERLAVTLRSISDAVVATDTEGRILLMNPVAEQMAGMPHAQAEGQMIDWIFILRDPSDRSQSDTDFYRISSTKSSPDSLKPALLIGASGQETYVQKRSAPIHDGAGRVTGAVIVYRDVTQERKSEEELWRASKLESLGLLAGGIAHDFNNVLTGIVGNLSLLRETPGLPADVAERMALLERTSYKARQLTLQLLTFAKGGSPIKQTASISEVLRESAEFALRGSNIRADFDFPGDLAAVEIDTGQMSQVVQNLVINSKQAMPQGGVLKILARNVRLDGTSNPSLPSGDYVLISISDTGLGIKREHLNRIFDPYFTTKTGGTGLGLATAYSILKRHDGLITVQSEWGQGSTFHLYLPASKTRLKSLGSDTPRKIQRSGRILAMDDEPAIRSLLTQVLGHFGCTSTVVPDGAEAIREFERARGTGEPYDAVIMDLTVPGGMGGAEAITHLRRIDPAVRAIVSSGYSNDPILANFRDHGFVARIEKPYRLNEVAAALREVLGQGDSPSTA